MGGRRRRRGRSECRLYRQARTWRGSSGPWNVRHVELQLLRYPRTAPVTQLQSIFTSLPWEAAIHVSCINYYKHLLEYIVRQKKPMPCPVIHSTQEKSPCGLDRAGEYNNKRNKSTNAEMSEPPCTECLFTQTRLLSCEDARRRASFYIQPDSCHVPWQIWVAAREV